MHQFVYKKYFGKELIQWDKVRNQKFENAYKKLNFLGRMVMDWLIQNRSNSIYNCLLFNRIYKSEIEFFKNKKSYQF